MPLLIAKCCCPAKKLMVTFVVFCISILRYRWQERTWYPCVIIWPWRSSQPATAAGPTVGRRWQCDSIKDARQSTKIYTGKSAGGHHQPALQWENDAAEQRRRISVGRLSHPLSTCVEWWTIDFTIKLKQFMLTRYSEDLVWQQLRHIFE